MKIQNEWKRRKLTLAPHMWTLGVAPEKPQALNETGNDSSRQTNTNACSINSMFLWFCSLSNNTARSRAQMLRGSAVKSPTGAGFVGKHGASLKINSSCEAISSSDKRPRSPAFTGTQYICETKNSLKKKKKQNRAKLPLFHIYLISATNNDMLIVSWLRKILAVLWIAWASTWTEQTMVLCHTQRLPLFTWRRTFFRQFVVVNHFLMLHDAVDDLSGKTGDIVNGGEFSWWQHHARIRVDWHWNAHIHIHIVQPIGVGLWQK